MNNQSTLQNQWQQLRQIDRNAWLFLSITIMDGLFFAGWGLYFNFFYLAQGFDRSWLGFFSGIHPAAMLVFALLMGVISDKIGQKRAMIIGTVGFLLASLISVTTRNPYIILIAIFISGVFDAMFIVNHLPVLSRLAGKNNKSFLFSLNFGLGIFSGMLGNFIAGYFPTWLQNSYHLQTGSSENYQTIMLTSLVLSVLTLIPLALINIPNQAQEHQEPESQNISVTQILRQPITWKLFAPGFLIGLGAALLVPFLNIFMVEKFALSEWGLGILFSVSGLLTGIGTLLAPTLEKLLRSRIRAVVLSQGLSLLFLLILGFGPLLSLAIFGFLLRNALMNMGAPLWDSFAMDQVPESQQARISSIMFIAWQIGWAVGPSISGFVQQNYGFTPLFITTSILYAIGILLTWLMFAKMDAPKLKHQLQPLGD